MARQSASKRLSQIELQIQKLEKEKREYEQKVFNEIGEFIVSKLGTNDVDEIKNKLNSFVDYDLSHNDNETVTKSEDSPEYRTENNSNQAVNNSSNIGS